MYKNQIPNSFIYFFSLAQSLATFLWEKTHWFYMILDHPLSDIFRSGRTKTDLCSTLPNKLAAESKS